MDNTFYTGNNNIESLSDEESSEEEDYSKTRFSNMVKTERYEKYRNKLFTPDIVKKKIVVDSIIIFRQIKISVLQILMSFLILKGSRAIVLPHLLLQIMIFIIT